MAEEKKIISKEDRINALSDLMEKQREAPYAVKWIHYRGYGPKPTKENVYEIPLELLRYNKYNGRILSRTMSYERQFHDLDPDNPKDIEEIEGFLWESKEERNQTTLDDIKRNDQQEPGIITKDGIVIDGNRRTLMLNKLFRKGIKDRSTFKAIILNDELEGHEKDILELETTYQMGQDKKLDYNPIEKYLKCSEMSNFFGTDEIAQFMGEDEPRILEWLEIKDLMDEYLEDLGYTGIYTRLDKREGHFVDLIRYLKKYEAGTTKLKRAAEPGDLSELKAIYFDYIRVPFPVQYCRIIGRPSEKYSFYCHRSGDQVWDEFKEAHFDIIESVEEKTVDQLREENPGDDLSKLLEARDKDWAEQVKEKLETNLENTERTLNDVNNSNAPYELLHRAYKTLNAVDTEVEEFKTDDRVGRMIEQIKEHLTRLENQRKN